ALVLLALLGAGRLEFGALVGGLAVLAVYRDAGVEGGLAEIRVVFEQPLAGAVEAEAEAGDGGVGDGLEGGADAGDLFAVRELFVDGGDVAVEVDVDLALEGDEEVGELVAEAGHQVDGAFERLVEERGLGLG